MSVIRLVIADDHPLVLQGISDFLSSKTGIEVVATCSDGAQALDAIRAFEPEVAVLDISMPMLNGLEVLAAATGEGLATRIVFLTADVDSREVMTAMAEGAHGLLLKESAPDELLRCVREVAAGRKCLPFTLLERLRENETQTAPVPIDRLLTPREWKVAALAADGLSNKEIARKLQMTEGTAKIHLHHIFKKLRVSNRTTLANVTFHQTQTRSLEK